jgi:hypothetical protein
MRKIIRIILSPLVFLFVMGALVVIPIGPITLVYGLLILGYQLLVEEPIDEDDVLFTFS